MTDAGVFTATDLLFALPIKKIKTEPVEEVPRNVSPPPSHSSGRRESKQHGIQEIVDCSETIENPSAVDSSMSVNQIDLISGIKFWIFIWLLMNHIQYDSIQ